MYLITFDPVTARTISPAIHAILQYVANRSGAPEVSAFSGRCWDCGTSGPASPAYTVRGLTPHDRSENGRSRSFPCRLRTCEICPVPRRRLPRRLSEHCCPRGIFFCSHTEQMNRCAPPIAPLHIEYLPNLVGGFRAMVFIQNTLDGNGDIAHIFWGVQDSCPPADDTGDKTNVVPWEPVIQIVALIAVVPKRTGKGLSRLRN